MSRAEQAPRFPLRRYRGALLLVTTLRKATRCALCWEPLAIGAQAWRVIRDNAARGVIRPQRYCFDHFLAEMEYDYRLPEPPR